MADRTDLPRSNLVPVLHGQSAAYLALAMREYASGERHSGIMQPVASDVTAGRGRNACAATMRDCEPRRPETPASCSIPRRRSGSRPKAIGKQRRARLPVLPWAECARDLSAARRTKPGLLRCAHEALSRRKDRLDRWRGDHAADRGQLTDQQIQDLAAYFAASGSPGR